MILLIEDDIDASLLLTLTERATAKSEDKDCHFEVATVSLDGKVYLAVKCPAIMIEDFIDYATLPF